MAASSRSSSSSSFDLYQAVTDQVLAMLEAGVAPWRSPILGRGAAGHPRNLASGKPYRGVNTFLLAFTAYAKGYESAYWLTFNQARERGGSVKRGEKSSMVVFWKLYETTDKQTGKPAKLPVLRYYNVFNAAAQCEGVAVPDRVTYTPTDFTPIGAAEQLLAGYADGPTVTHGGASAYYRPKDDAICIPEPRRFETPEDYYATLFHEHAHGTGHSRRLDRRIDTDPQPFGSADYGREELVAEMAAAFLCGRCGLTPATLANQAAYLQGWMRTIKQDKKLVVASAGAAQRAADWVAGERTPPGGESAGSSNG